MILYLAFASAMHLSRALPESASHLARATLYPELVDSARTSPRTPEVICRSCPSLRHVSRASPVLLMHTSPCSLSVGLGSVTGAWVCAPADSIAPVMARQAAAISARVSV